MSSVTNAYSQRIEIDTGGWINAVAFTRNSNYLVTGGGEEMQVWRVRDGEQVATIQVKSQVWCIAVSKDGKWITAGSHNGEVLVWDSTTYKQVSVHKAGEWPIRDVDFSPAHSYRLVSSSDDSTAVVWDIAPAQQKVHTLFHNQWVAAAKYSPAGNRIATASGKSVRVWDSDDGRLLADIQVNVELPRDLLWSDDNLVVKTDYHTIKQINASTGSTISKWTVPYASYYSCIALPQHGKFLVYSADDTITFWSNSTHTQLGLIQESHDIRSLVFSPDDHFLAFVTSQPKIIIKDVSLAKELEVCIDSAALNAWQHDQLTRADKLLTAAIPAANVAAHHVLASRALVRARLQHWDAALVDAEGSISIQPSAIGYIAKCVGHFGKGETHAGYTACLTASHHFQSNRVTPHLIKVVVMFMAGEHQDAISHMDHLITIASWDPTFYVVQAYMYFFLGNLHMKDGHYERATQSFERARAKLGDCTDQPPLIVTLISGWKFDDLLVMIWERFCDALFATGYTKEACESALRMLRHEVNVTKPVKAWAADLMEQYLSKKDDHASEEFVYDESMQVPHGSHSMNQLTREWANFKLAIVSWKDALNAAASFMLPRSIIYQIICEHLEMTGQIVDAVGCFHQMCRELGREISGEQANWARVFESQSYGKLENLGDSAMNAKEYDKAILQYTAALSLSCAIPQDLLAKRSRARAEKGLWEDALFDANEVIRLDPSSFIGYERKRKILHNTGHYWDAVDTVETMLSSISQLSDPKIWGEGPRSYVRPAKTKEAIRATIQDVIRDSPPVLINTTSGRLCGRSEQVAAFESRTAFMKLVSSMTTDIDHISIKEEVGGFYRYATFSHKWEENEPLYEKVMQIVVYDLEESPTHEKLQMFCKTVRKAGFNWAWSDTCCINKADNFVLQEALVSMFKWYEGSAMTIIFLRGVYRLALRGALMESIWNTRAWTLQEYHASKVVRFYTEDWTPYLGLNIYNHKDSPEIISEMEKATGISAKALVALRPGLNDIRKKLRLASTRQSTRVEDAAYSLLGIFSLSLPVVYGEGDGALGRLLAQLLTDSGDTSILAWTGRSGSFNSCLPASTTVFTESPTSHIPTPITSADTKPLIVGPRAYLGSYLALFTALYDQLHRLPVPSFAGRRLKLPCLSFKLGRVSVLQNRSEQIFRAQANALGVVEIRTQEDLSQLGSLYLIHPWIDFLLDQQSVEGGAAESINVQNMDDRSSILGELPSFPGISNTTSSTQKTRTARLIDRLGRTFTGRSTIPSPNATSFRPRSTFLGDGQSITSSKDITSLLPPSTMSPVEKQMRVLRFVARLRRPFGALLLTPTRSNVEEYRRVATESLITVQVDEITPTILDKLMNSVRMLDVL